MEIIERIYKYLEFKSVSPYEFERKCEISNGYLNSRKTGTRGIGSEILEKVYKTYPDLNLVWLITGDGEMIADKQAQLQAQLHAQPQKSDEFGKEGKQGNPGVDLIVVMQDQINTLKASVADKDKIILLLEAKSVSSKKPVK